MKATIIVNGIDINFMLPSAIIAKLYATMQYCTTDAKNPITSVFFGGAPFPTAKYVAQKQYEMMRRYEDTEVSLDCTFVPVASDTNILVSIRVQRITQTFSLTTNQLNYLWTVVEPYYWYDDAPKYTKHIAYAQQRNKFIESVNYTHCDLVGLNPEERLHYIMLDAIKRGLPSQKIAAYCGLKLQYVHNKKWEYKKFGQFNVSRTAKGCCALLDIPYATIED